jgi:hypothetical protein
MDEVWSSNTGLSLRLEVEPNDELGHEVEAYLQGGWSTQAMRDAEEAVGKIFESVVRTIILGVTKVEQELGTPPECNLEIIFAEMVGSKSGNESNALYAPLDYLLKRDGSAVLRTSLSAYFSPDDDGDDELLRRVRNATILLAHADQSPSGPIALSLCFAAIEALICEDGKIGEQIREHIPVLLESDPKKRTSKKRTALYDLYDLRSKVLHGSDLSVSKEASKTVRRIAAGVVRAICVWMARWEQERDQRPCWKNLLDAVMLGTCTCQPLKPEIPNMGELLPIKVPKKDETAP